MSDNSDLMSGIAKLKRYGEARDRQHEPTGRDVVLTDEEAVAILRQLPHALVRAATDPNWARPAVVLPAVRAGSHADGCASRTGYACNCRRAAGQFGPWGAEGRQGS